MSRYKRNSGLIQKRAYVYWHTTIQQERFQLRFILYSAQISELMVQFNEWGGLIK